MSVEDSRSDDVMSRVLIVNDVPETLGATPGLMEAEGCEVALASSAEQALQMIDAKRPDVVLFNVLNPPKGAIDFARRLALNRGSEVIPVVMVTALSDYQIDSFLNGVPGVRRILHAPCPPEAMAEAVSQALRVVHQ